MQKDSVFIGYSLDWDLFERELQTILGTHSFTSLCAAHSSTENHICTIQEVRLEHPEEYLYEIVVKADRFVYKMIRNLIGTLMAMSRSKMSLSMAALLEMKNRDLAGATAPAKGLTLEYVRYDEVA